MTVLDWIIRYWVQWLFGLISAALLAGYRRLAKQEKERKAIKERMPPKINKDSNA